MGLVFDVTDYIHLGNTAKSWKFAQEYQKEELPLADRVGVRSLNVMAKYKLESTLRQFTAALAARMTGGTSANGLMRIVRETITKSGNTVTLTSGAGANQAVVGIINVYDTVNKTYRAKAGAAAANEAYTLATNVLTMHASDTGTTFEVTYAYTDTSSSIGTKLVIPSQSFPSQCRVLLPYAYQQTDGSFPSKWMIVDAQKALPVGPIEIGAEAQAFVEIPFNCDILNEADGDLTFYFDSFNPAF